MKNITIPKWLLVVIPTLIVFAGLYFMASSCQSQTGKDQSTDPTNKPTIQLTIPPTSEKPQQKTTKDAKDYYSATEKSKWEIVDKTFNTNIVPTQQINTQQWANKLDPIVSPGLKTKLLTVDKNNIPTGKLLPGTRTLEYGDNYLVRRAFYSGNLIVDYRVIRDNNGKWMVDDYRPQKR